MKKENINLDKLNLHNIFSITGGEKYKIPKYQRAYAWEKSNAEKLWNDISELLGKNDKNYFIGSIVQSQSKETPIIEIIDGQQRLTTLSLLILALYIEYYQLDQAKATTHILKYLKVGDIDDEYEILTLSRRNSEFFHKLINISEKDKLELLKDNEYQKESKSNKNLFDVLNYFIEQIEKDKLSDHNLEITRLNNLLKTIRDNIFFIVIKVPDYAEASKLFEVLNNRGVDLTNADLIKNHLFSIAEQQSTIDNVEKDWYEFEDTIGTDKLEQFFRYFSFLYSRDPDLYTRMEKTILTKSAKTVSTLIVKHSKTYKMFLDPSYSNDDKESSFLDELSILGNTQYYSFLMSAYKKFEVGDIMDLLDFMIKFTFRYSTICGKNPNKVESLYSELAYTINGDKETISSIKEKIIKLNPSDDEFKLNFYEKEFKSTKIPRYILGKIEDKISSGEKNIDFNSVHLEHIMPKKIEKWIEKDGSFEKLHKEYVNNIGNMVLLSEKINTSVKNNIFTEKLKSYATSEINIMSYVKDIVAWDRKAIEGNRDRYYNEAKIIWKLDV